MRSCEQWSLDHLLWVSVFVSVWRVWEQTLTVGG